MKTQVISWTKKMIDAILESVCYFPKEFCQVSSYLIQEASKKFGPSCIKSLFFIVYLIQGLIISCFHAS